jgi:outer membrane protein assembly factor BamB
MAHASGRSLSLSRIAALFMLVSMGVGGLPASASAAVPGAQLWEKPYNGPADGTDYATALGVSPNGSQVFVTGYSSWDVGVDYLTVALDANTGSLVWATTYNDSADGFDYATALGVSPDGSRVFVTGYIYGSTGDYATVAYDAATGTQLWTRRYNGPGNDQDEATALGVSPDGSRVFVTGQSLGSTGTDDYATVAYDASTGASRGVKRYDGTGQGSDTAYALGVSPDGSEVFVSGLSFGSATSGYDYATVAYGVT